MKYDGLVPVPLGLKELVPDLSVAGGSVWAEDVGWDPRGRDQKPEPRGSWKSGGSAQQNLSPGIVKSPAASKPAECALPLGSGPRQHHLLEFRPV